MNVKSLCLSLFACMSCILFGCDGSSRVSGHIVDGNGVPIDGATVTLFQGDDQVGIEHASDAEGDFAAGGMHAPSSTPLEFHVKKKGYKEDVRRLPVGDNGFLRVVLERDLKQPKGP